MIFAKIFIFILGMYLSIRVIAALYRILDLWYDIRNHYGKVIRGILGWGGITLAISLLLNGHWRSLFCQGLIIYAFVFLLNNASLRFLIYKKFRPSSGTRVKTVS